MGKYTNTPTSALKAALRLAKDTLARHKNGDSNKPGLSDVREQKELIEEELERRGEL